MSFISEHDGFASRYSCFVRYENLKCAGKSCKLRPASDQLLLECQTLQLGHLVVIGSLGIR